MNIKFGVFWKQNLGTIYKDNSITTLGKEADVDLNLSEVSSIHANFKVDGKNQGWYMAALGEVETEDGWMFNCCYIPAKEVTPEGGSGRSKSGTLGQGEGIHVKEAS